MLPGRAKWYKSRAWETQAKYNVKEFKFQSIPWLITIRKVIWKCCYSRILFLIFLLLLLFCFFFLFRLLSYPNYLLDCLPCGFGGLVPVFHNLQEKTKHNIKDANKTYGSWCVGFVKYTWVCWGRVMKSREGACFSKDQKSVAVGLCKWGSPQENHPGMEMTKLGTHTINYFH